MVVARCIFKLYLQGWGKERVFRLPSNEAGRVVLVLGDDPPAHKKKVQKVVEMMEMDLGSGWLIHSLCKVYLYITQKRIAGCLVAEPINTAHRVLSSLGSSKNNDAITANTNKSEISKLRSEGVHFHRESLKREFEEINSKGLEEDFLGVVFLEKEIVFATCGIRAIYEKE